MARLRRPCCSNPRLKWVGRDRKRDRFVVDDGSESKALEPSAFEAWVRNMILAGRNSSASKRIFGPIVHAYVCQNCGKADRTTAEQLRAAKAGAR